MIQQWRTALLARELERIAEHQPKGELCRGCSRVGYPELWPCITVEVADQTVRSLRQKLATGEYRGARGRDPRRHSPPAGC